MINREPVLSLVFSILFIWYSRNTGHSFWVYWAHILPDRGALVLGIFSCLPRTAPPHGPAGVVPPYR